MVHDSKQVDMRKYPLAFLRGNAGVAWWNFKKHPNYSIYGVDIVIQDRFLIFMTHYLYILVCKYQYYEKDSYQVLRITKAFKICYDIFTVYLHLAVHLMVHSNVFLLQEATSAKGPGFYRGFYVFIINAYIIAAVQYIFSF